MMTIIADEGKNKIGLELRQAFLAKGAQAENISVGNCNLPAMVVEAVRDGAGLALEI